MVTQTATTACLLLIQAISRRELPIDQRAVKIEQRAKRKTSAATIRLDRSAPIGGARTRRLPRSRFLTLTGLQSSGGDRRCQRCCSFLTGESGTRVLNRVCPATSKQASKRASERTSERTSEPKRQQVTIRRLKRTQRALPRPIVLIIIGGGSGDDRFFICFFCSSFVSSSSTFLCQSIDCSARIDVRD